MEPPPKGKYGGFGGCLCTVLQVYYAGRSCEVRKIRHINVWGVRTDGKTQEQITEEDLQAMEGYMREIGVVMNLAELGVTEEMIPGIVAATLPMTGGHRTMLRKISRQC
jgi:alcohol dehydrogenase YqhD (iron-dependent ADH family)